MATQGTNLSIYNKDDFQDVRDAIIGIVAAEWNGEITDNLLKGAHEALLDCGLSPQNILVHRVPGSYELPLGAQYLLQARADVDAVVCLGSVIRGETEHFTFVCESCALGIKDVMLKYNKPVSFGVLTDDNIEQSRARSGGALGNKGVEAAVSILKMIQLKRSIS